MSEFAHLHLHTEYSLLDGLGRINDYMERAKQLDMRHIAISDHGVMYGVVDWYKAARKHDLSPVIGMEAYLAPWQPGRSREVFLSPPATCGK